MKAKILFFCAVVMASSDPLEASEVSQRVGAYSSSNGESRALFKFSGRADAPASYAGSLQTALNVSVTTERARYAGEAFADDDYIKKNFESGKKSDNLFDGSIDLVFNKRTELSLGGASSSDTVTKSQSGRMSLGQWLFGDQLRVGVAAQRSFTKRPKTTPLDKDAVTLTPSPKIVTESIGPSVKAILNPTTIISGDYSYVKSTDRPVLRSYNVGVKQFFPGCACAVHGEAGRTINLGDLNTNMTTGELTGTQFSLAYLQTLPGNAHGRLAYRYAREDEYTRAYRDHLVFGADSYTATVAKEFQAGVSDGPQRPLMVDLSMTRYLHNDAGSATTIEMGAGLKF